MSDNAFDWGGDPFTALDSPSAPAPIDTPFQPQRRKRKAIPDQKQIFRVQRQLQKLGEEIDQLDGAAAAGARVAYAAVWKTFNAYLREWAQ